MQQPPAYPTHSHWRGSCNCHTPITSLCHNHKQHCGFTKVWIVLPNNTNLYRSSVSKILTLVSNSIFPISPTILIIQNLNKFVLTFCLLKFLPNLHLKRQSQPSLATPPKCSLGFWYEFKQNNKQLKSKCLKEYCIVYTRINVTLV